MKDLKQDSPAELRPFIGDRDLLITGASASVCLEKSLDKGENFYPMTDVYGTVVTFHSSAEGVLFNANISNSNGDVRYRLVLISGDASYEVV